MKRGFKPENEWLAAHRYRQQVLLRIVNSAAERTPDEALLILNYSDADLGLLFRSGLELSAIDAEETEGRLDRKRKARYGN